MASIKLIGVHEIICRIVESYANKTTVLDMPGYVSLETVEADLDDLHTSYMDFLRDELTEDELKEEFSSYLCDESLEKLIESKGSIKSTDKKKSYNVLDLLKDTINDALNKYNRQQQQKQKAEEIQGIKNGTPTEANKEVPRDYRIQKIRVGKTTYLKGYPGLGNLYCQVKEEFDGKPIEKNVFDFLKGSLDFRTLRKINNIYRQSADIGKVPQRPFICIEESVYEFTSDYSKRIERERELLLKVAEAIIHKTVLKITYRPLSGRADDLEFHPQYIRRVGRKLMLFGESKSIKYGESYTLVNLVFSRIEAIEPMTDKVAYREATVDYNGDFFASQMSYNPKALMAVVKPETIILRAKRERLMTNDVKVYPFRRLLAEPLHYTQKEVYWNGTDYDEDPTHIDKDYGYVALQITDAMYILPILLAWGNNLEVMLPEKLRNRMATEIQLMAETYAVGRKPEEKIENKQGISDSAK